MRDVFGKRVINTSRNLYIVLYLGTKLFYKVVLYKGM